MRAPKNGQDRRKLAAQSIPPTASSGYAVMRLCGQIFRYAVATGLVERDVTVDLKGALSSVPQTHHAAITEPKQAGDLMRSIYGYAGHPYAVAALKLSPRITLP
jgi:hypothetical protein